MATSTLSYKDTYGWGLRVQPSFDQLLQSTKKPLRIPKPDRNAKWFALSNYRAFMLDAARKAHDYEHLQLDYDQSGAQLPRNVAMQHPAPEGDDPAWDRMRQAAQDAEEHDDYERAFDFMDSQRMQEAARLRAEQLAAVHAPYLGHWYIGENHEDLEEAGVEHDNPLPRPQLTTTALPGPVVIPNGAGQMGLLRPFPSFEQLNLGQPRNFRQPIARIRPQDQGYEGLRANALEGRDPRQ